MRRGAELDELREEQPLLDFCTLFGPFGLGPLPLGLGAFGPRPQATATWPDICCESFVPTHTPCSRLPSDEDLITHHLRSDYTHGSEREIVTGGDLFTASSN